MNNLCPLFEPLPTCDDSELEPRIRQCIKVIEKARELWNCFPQSDKNKYPTWKLDSAQAIWNLCPENDLFSIPLNEAIGKVKIFSSPKIDDRITDYQIYAIFVIYKICLVLHYLSKPEYKDSHDVRRLYDDATKLLSFAIKDKAETQVQDNPEFKTQRETGTHKGNIFCCLGDTWEIKLKEDYLQVQDSKYMKYIQYILEHPLKKLSLLELDKVFELKQQTNITKEQQKECMDILGSSNNLGKITKQDNENSKKYYEDKIKILADEIEIAKETGNKEKESELQANHDEIAKILSSKEYKTRIPNQKDRNEESILKGINRCIESIKDASNMANKGKLIAEHIDRNIERSKYHIVYSPEGTPNWNL